MRVTVLLAAIIASVTLSACGDVPAPLVNGTITVAADVDPAEWVSLQVRFGGEGAWQGPFSAQHATSDVTFPFDYSLGGGFGGNEYDAWRVDAWLSNSDTADTQTEPGDGEPAATALVECTYGNDDCASLVVDLEIEAAP
jgi:hypothetical protein